MGVSIDKSILYMSLYKQRLEESISDGLEEDIEAYDLAITSMRKYQKIEEIMHIEMNGKEALQEIERILRG